MSVSNNDTRKRKVSRGRKSTRGGRELIAAVKEMHRAVTTGDYRGMTIREVEIADPRSFDASAVRRLRTKTGTSILVFAQLCGVSSKLVEHWEQGRRLPAPLACRLLERIDADPAAYLKSLVKRRKVG